MKRKLILSLLLMLTAIGIATAQSITVRGNIVDENGVPVTGATVRIKSTPTKGAQSDLDGNFVLEAQKGELLLISFVGFTTQEVKAAPQLKIRLVPDQELLDEVVVVGYGSGRAKSTTTASVVKVSAKDLESKPSPNVFEGLQGKVAGLDVSATSGEPGKLSDMRLHGHGSLGLGSAPLYILDGMPVGQGTIMGLNPNDYESVQVLKDASATSIYGSRASNGVIFITTKRGQASQRATITLTGQYGVSNLANKTFYNKMLTADELANFWLESGLKDKDFLEQHRKTYPGDTRWVDYFFRKNAPTYNATLSISGGAGATSYYISGQHYFQQGLFAGNSLYSKSNLRANISTRVNDWLSVYSNNGIYFDNSISAFSSSNNSYTSQGLFYVQQPFFSPYKEDGSMYYDEVIPGYDWYSPYYIADMDSPSATTFEYLGNLGFTIRPLKGLVIQNNIGLDFSNYYWKLTSDPRAKYQPQNGFREQEFTRGIEWTFTNTIEYSFNINDDHGITLLAGHEFNRYDGEGFWANGTGLKDHRLLHFDQLTDKTKINVGSASANAQYAYLSYFGRLSYNLMDRYYLDLTVRNDASSKFPPRHRNATFWSAGIKWNAKKEAFLNDVKWLNRLDVKLSSGTSGNSALGNYAYFATATNSSNYKGMPSRVIGEPGNPDLTWEKQNKTTLAFDAELFGRLGINFELYNRLTTDMVMSVPFTYTSGVSSNTQNVGSYRNRGIDLRVDYDIWKDRKGNYVSVYTNLNYNEDRVMSLFQGLDTWTLYNSNLIYRVGKPITFFMPIFKQINPKTGDPEWYNPSEDTSVTHKDDNDFTTSTFNQEALAQSTGIPRFAPWRGGFGLNANYKGFFVAADFAFVLGKYMINNDLYFSDNPVNFSDSNTSRDALNYWKQPGDQTRYPSLNHKVFLQFDTRMLVNSSYMRLKNLSIGYQIPRSILDKQDFFTGVKVSLTGRNLWTVTKYNGSDPEPDMNIAFGRNPNTMQFMGSIELKF